MPYQPIENYGLIGNLRTAALVGMDGSIDWLCLPRFDSPSVFARHPRRREGRPLPHRARDGEDATSQAVLLARHQRPRHPLPAPRRRRRVDDYMPVGGAAARAGRTSSSGASRVVARHDAVPPGVPARLRLRPRAARDRAGDRQAPASTRRASSSGSRRPSRCSDRRRRRARATSPSSEGQTATFVLRQLDRAKRPGTALDDRARRKQRFRETVAYWQRWLSHCTYHGRWREMVHRSALALKLLTYEPTGAIVAAPTCSLPERHRRRAQLGLPLHLDPRRRLHPVRADAHRLHRGGRRGSWTGSTARCAGAQSRRRPAADHVRHRRPGRADRVRARRTSRATAARGRCASATAPHDQLQLDIYGELMDSVLPVQQVRRADRLRRLDGPAPPASTGSATTGSREDEGIWEVARRAAALRLLAS